MKVSKASFQDGPSSGLSALVVYFRPVAREQVLRTLVSAGVFTRELDHSAASVPMHRVGRADFGVVFASGEPREPAIVRAYHELVQAILVVVPGDAGPSDADFWQADRVCRSAPGMPLARGDVMDVALLARRRSEGRLIRSQPPPAVICGGIVFRPTQPILRRGNNVAGLSPTEFGVLRALVSAKGSMVSKTVLQLELTGGAAAASDGYLKTVVLRIRRKVEKLGGDASHLAAIRGSGYLLRP